MPRGLWRGEAQNLNPHASQQVHMREANQTCCAETFLSFASNRSMASGSFVGRLVLPSSLKTFNRVICNQRNTG